MNNENQGLAPTEHFSNKEEKTTTEGWDKEFDDRTEQYIRDLLGDETKWATKDDYPKTLVAGNIRTFAHFIKEDLADLPANLLFQERQRIVEKVMETNLEINIDEYLPMVKRWTGGYDVPFEDGYNQAKRDITKALSDKEELKDK